MPAESKISLHSDLHVDYSPMKINSSGASVLIIAGDVMDNNLNLSSEFSLHPSVMWCIENTDPDIPVIFVPGNHDIANSTFDEAKDSMLRASHKSHVHVLWNDEVEINGIRFVGSPLFSSLKDPLFSDDVVLAAIENNFDLKRTLRRNASGKYEMIDVKDFLEQYNLCRNYLEMALSRPDSELEKTIVITHWSPTFKIKSNFKIAPGRSYWYSDQEDLVKKVPLWIHGHTHQSGVAHIGRSPKNGWILSNQRGVCLPGGKSQDKFYKEQILFNLSDFK